jgi:hypothetical protein
VKLILYSVVLLLGCTAAPGQVALADDSETQLKQRIADQLADLAEWCSQRGLKEPGREIREEILFVDPPNRRARALLVPLSGESSTASTDDMALRQRQTSTGRMVAPLYLELFAGKHRPTQNAMYDVYLLRALQHDPAVAAAVFERTWKTASRENDWARARMLITAGGRYVPIAGERELLERLDAAQMQEIRRQSVPGGSFVLQFPELGPTVKKDYRLMQMHVVLPEDYSADRQWPLYISLGGGGGSDKPNRLAAGLGFVSVGLPYPRNRLNLDQAAFSPFTLWSYYKPMLQKLDRVLPNLHPTNRVVFGFSNGANAITALVAFSDTQFTKQYRFLIIHEGGMHQTQWSDEVWQDLQSCAILYSGGDKAGGRQITRMHTQAVEKNVDAELLIFAGRHEMTKEVRDTARAWIRRKVGG